MGRRLRTVLGVCCALAGAASTPALAQAALTRAHARGVQGDLGALGLYPGAVDGRWGLQSSQALRRFQAAEGLAETGRADPDTLARLRQRLRPAAMETPGQDPTAVRPAVVAPLPLPAPAFPVDAVPSTPHVPQALTAPSEAASTVPDRPGAPVPDPGARPMAEAAGTAVPPSPAPVPAAPVGSVPSAPAGPYGDRRAPMAWLVAPGGILALWLWRRRSRRRASAAPVVSPGANGALPRTVEASGSVVPAAPRQSDLTVVPPAAAGSAPALPAPSTASVAMARFATTATDLSPAAEITLDAWAQTSPQAGSAQGVHAMFGTLRDPGRAARPTPATRPDRHEARASPHRTAGDRAWVPKGKAATVGGFILPGLVYVGRTLPSSEGYGRNDNCLIDPGLAVVKGGADVAGQHMDYWPAYERMRPSSRRALLEWLAGDRADPGTFIGYVFVYLYGLERRAVLDASAEDRPAIRAEVERLLSVYGHNGSFRRYAGALLSALEILDLDAGGDLTPVFAPNGGELPPSVRIAVGVRIRDGRPLEAEWLLAWTMSHPETRVRTPARRAFDVLKEEFAAEFLGRHPSGGLPVRARKGKDAPVRYRAASGTFTADLGQENLGPLPDLANHTEPLALGRALLETCTDRLDAYSRHLGRAGGPSAAPTLQAMSLLPPSQRHRALAGPAAGHLAWLIAQAGAGALVTFGEASAHVFGQAPEKVTPAGLRDLADTLCRFGMGIVPDPRFPTRLPAGATSLLLFALDASSEEVAGPSDAYMAAFLALSVGVLVAKADGAITADERASLRELASGAPGAPGASPVERRRLAVDALWLEANPVELSSLRIRLAGLGPEHRQAVGDALVRVASGDGSHHRAEVILLEKAFRHLGLERERLYAALHRAGPAEPAAVTGVADDLVRFTVGSATERTYAIPDGPNAASVRTPALPAAADRGKPSKRVVAAEDAARGPTPERVDFDRLAAIRAETAAVSSVLAGIFDAETAGADAPDAPLSVGTGDDPADGSADGADGALDGLDARHGQLLRELAARAAWPRVEFDRLARELGLMPNAAMEELNAWAFERFDDLLVEDGDPVHLNLHLVPEPMTEAA